jgi:glutamate N-acetyltransferase/amino-acid N-acetyltransferase
LLCLDVAAENDIVPADFHPSFEVRNSMTLTTIENGTICSPQGFRSAGVAAGIKESGNADLALIVSDTPASVAGAFTQNTFAAPSVHYSRELCEAGAPVRAIVVNAGNANACTGDRGVSDNLAMAQATADELSVSVNEVLVSSTGKIGTFLPMKQVQAGIAAASAALSASGGHDAAQAIMTTDTVPKSTAVSINIDGVTVTVGGMAKGAGMIAPRMKPAVKEATMLAYLTTDAVVDPGVLNNCLARSLDASFNRITIDGDTSTNDAYILLANGAAGNTPIRAGSDSELALQQAVNAVAAELARMLVIDGEGATHFVEVCVSGAANDAEARQCADAIANSLLCKTAWFGGDPNWGRILDAAGYSGAAANPAKTSLAFNGVAIVEGGMPAGSSQAEMDAAVAEETIRVELDLGVGDGSFTVWTCDLSYDYVKINAEYHT